MKTMATMSPNLRFDSYTLFATTKDTGSAFLQLLGGSFIRNHLKDYREADQFCRDLIVNYKKVLAALNKNTALAKDYAYALGLRNLVDIVVNKDLSIDMDMYSKELTENCGLLIRSDLVIRKGDRLYLRPEQ